MGWTEYKKLLDKEMLKLFYKKHFPSKSIDKTATAIYSYEIKQADNKHGAELYYVRMPRTNRSKAYEQNEMLTKFMLDKERVIVHSFSSNGVSGKIVEVVTQKTGKDLYLTAFTIER